MHVFGLMMTPSRRCGDVDVVALALFSRARAI